MLKAGLTVMKRIAETLQAYGSYDVFTEGVLSSDDIRRYVSKEKMT